MLDVIDLVIKAQNSESYIRYQKYHSNNILGFTKVSRWELMHSNFIAWLLDDNTALLGNHQQLYKFVLMLLLMKRSPVNDKARIDCNVLNKFFNPCFIESASVRREDHNIDILIEIKTKEKTLPIIIENKVDSKENGKNKDQTQVYFDYAEKRYADDTKYFKPIYVFLVPLYNKTSPKCDAYLITNYQKLVDYVIQPIMYACTNEVSKQNIKIYLQSLSFQKDNEKGDEIMAISEEEREILKSFIKENKDIFDNAIELLDLSPAEKDRFREATANSADTTQYSLNGSDPMGKGRLVLAVVKLYCDEHPDCDFNALKDAFPNTLGKSKKKGIVSLEQNVSDEDKGIKGGHKRYFVDDPITLQSSQEKVLVSNQWDIDGIKRFIDYCKKNFSNYDIQVVNN